MLRTYWAVSVFPIGQDHRILLRSGFFVREEADRVRKCRFVWPCGTHTSTRTDHDGEQGEAQKSEPPIEDGAARWDSCHRPRGNHRVTRPLVSRHEDYGGNSPECRENKGCTRRLVTIAASQVAPDAPPIGVNLRPFAVAATDGAYGLNPLAGLCPSWVLCHEHRRLIRGAQLYER
jgi:hypothetical protein